MSEKIHSFTVALENNLSEDRAQQLRAALYQLRGVVNVTGNVADVESHIAMARAENEYRNKILDVLFPKERGK